MLTKRKFTFSDNSDRARSQQRTTTGTRVNSRRTAGHHTVQTAGLPEDYAPKGIRPIPLLPGVFIVDVVVNNTDPNLTNTDTFNDGETSITVNPALGGVDHAAADPNNGVSITFTAIVMPAPATTASPSAESRTMEEAV